MITRQHHEQGFSAVELLITLFVAVAFLGTGYQLYSIIIKGSGDAQARANASNIAYTALRQYATQATNPCTAVTPSPTPTLPSGNTLPNPTISVTITCPLGTTSGTSKVTSTVTYGSPTQEVIHALYVTN